MAMFSSAATDDVRDLLTDSLTQNDDPKNDFFATSI